MQEATYDVKVKIAKANRLNPYADITPYALEIGFPFVNYPNFYPTSEEILIYAVPASTFTDKEKVVGYTGKSSGVSVRVAKGVSLRTGGTGSRAIRDTVRQSNYGDLLVTNKRVIFVGKDDSFEFQIGKISTLKFLDGESFLIQSGRTSKNVCLDSVNVIYAYALITCSIDWNTEGKDAYTLVNESQSEITQEEMAYCDQIRQECFQMVLPKEPRPQKNKGCLVAVIAVFLIIVFLYAMGDYFVKRDDEKSLRLLEPMVGTYTLVSSGGYEDGGEISMYPSDTDTTLTISSDGDYVITRHDFTVVEGGSADLESGIVRYMEIDGTLRFYQVGGDIKRIGYLHTDTEVLQGCDLSLWYYVEQLGYTTIWGYVKDAQ